MIWLMPKKDHDLRYLRIGLGKRLSGMAYIYALFAVISCYRVNNIINVTYGLVTYSQLFSLILGGLNFFLITTICCSIKMLFLKVES
jgi:hypothetical protein